MNELVIIAPQSIGEAEALSKTLARSSLVPKVYHGKPEDVLAILLRGAELGFPPMTALSAFVVIQGQVALKAETMAALCRKRGDVCKYIRILKTDATECVVETQRVGDPEKTTMSFTMADAKAAGLLGNPTWSKYPAAMLRARCLSALCRAVYSDLVLGLYDPDEISEPERLLPEARPLPQMVDVTPMARPTLKQKMAVIDSLVESGAIAPNEVAREMKYYDSPRDANGSEVLPEPGSDIDESTVDPFVDDVSQLIAEAKSLAELKAIQKQRNSKAWSIETRKLWAKREGELRAEK